MAISVPGEAGAPDLSHLILEDRISYYFVNSEFPKGWMQKYMPNDRLNELITEDAIITEFSRLDELDNWGESSHRQVVVDKDLLSFITTSAKKLFAIALDSGISSSRLHTVMKIFKAAGYGDSKLPASMDPSRPPWSHLYNRLSMAVKDRFEDNQWKFLAPTFCEDQVTMELDRRHILPFKLINDQRREGNFSDVWEVAIDKAHQEKPMVCCITFFSFPRLSLQSSTQSPFQSFLFIGATSYSQHDTYR